MRYLLDTNIVSDLVHRPQGRIAERIRTVGEAQVCTSIIVAAELRYGAAKSMNPAKALAAQDQLLNLIDMIPFDQAAADAYGQIRATLEQQGRPIGANDLLIAATALSRQMTLVTHNTGEFSRVGGLLLEDWE